jgi:hypothetical protein
MPVLVLVPVPVYAYLWVCVCVLAGLPALPAMMERHRRSAAFASP